MMSSSSEKFHALLDRLGVQNESRPLKDADLEWMWADESSAVMLDWLIENLDEENLTTFAERTQYEVLSEQGLVLKGKHLEDALSSVQSDHDLDEVSLDEKIREMEEEVEKLNKKRSRLRQVSSDLRNKIAQCKTEFVKVEGVSKEVEQEMRTQLQKCEQDHMKFKDTLADLKVVIEKLHAAYAGNSCELFSQVDLQPIHQTEQSYTSALAQFTDKRFFEGLSQVASTDESCYQLLNLSDSNQLAVQQEGEQTLANSSTELERLRYLLPKSVERNINMEVNSAEAKAGCEALEECDGVVGELSKMGSDQLRNQLERLKGKLAIHNRELSTNKDKDLKSLIEETSMLKEAYILTGDYNLKISRQQYFLDCQQQVIQKLVDQRARNELLTLMLEIEMEDVQRTRHVLASVTTYLQQLSTASKQQLAMLGDAEVVSHKYDRNVIDTRNVLLNTVDQLVGGQLTPQAGKLFTSYKELVSSASEFVTHHQEKITTSNSPSRQLEQMKEASDACLKELRLTLGDANPLVPQNISSRITELKLQLKLLEKNIKTIMSTVTLKRKLLNER